MRSRDRHLSDRQLVAKIDRELTGDRLAVVEAHLAQCDACRARGEQLLAATLAVRMALRAENDRERHVSAARERLARALDEEHRGIEGRRAASAPRWHRSGLLAGVTTSAAILLAAFVLAGQPKPRVETVAAEVTGALPIARVTPGAVSTLTAAELCGGAEPSRIVAPATARQVLREYGMENVPADQFELDALITPELGGTPVPANLWPQRYTGSLWTAYVKDELEIHLRSQVCRGEIDLRTAQREIATDWIGAYKRHLHRDRPLQMVRTNADAPELTVATRTGEAMPRLQVLFAAQRSQLE